MRSTLMRRIHREESGAVLMIVAISMIVLVGMLVLTVDLGRAVAVKREMVAGTDAAALAAAQQCATGNSFTSASTAADDVLGENKSGATVTAFDAPNCGVPPAEPQYVTVESTVDVNYFFAGIFGFDSGPVVSRAVVQWGVLVNAFGAPITVDLVQLGNCGIDVSDLPHQEEIENCNLDYPKDALQEPRWGALDLDDWGDPDAAPCHTSASDLIGVINNGGNFDLLPTPAYDCLDNGLSDAVWEALEGKTLLFPILDVAKSTGTVKPNRKPLGGTDCTGAQIPSLKAAGFNCQLDTAYIVGWIQLFVEDVSKHGSGISVKVDYRGLTTGGGTPGTGTDFGVRAIRLVD